jgi:quinol monooxygenase YgiN
MLTVQVNIRVKEENLDEFIAATLENAGNSITEEGVVRFDFYQDNDDPTRFILIEVYRSRNAQLMHKETPHYLKWKQIVEGYMFEPRFSRKYKNLFPEEKDF